LFHNHFSIAKRGKVPYTSQEVSEVNFKMCSHLLPMVMFLWAGCRINGRFVEYDFSGKKLSGPWEGLE
jgi:hypothetical protein